MQSIATKKRINQITFVVFVTFLFYQLTNWVGGFWVPLSAIVIASPFSTFLTIQKAKNRFIGTILGLFAAILLQYYLRMFPEQLPIIVVIMAFFLGFAMNKDYKYYIALVTLSVCLSFSYSNTPYTSFEPSSLFLARLMGVSGAVFIFLALQTFVFGKNNARLEIQEETDNLCVTIKKECDSFAIDATPASAFNTAIQINDAGKTLLELMEASTLIFDSNEDALQNPKKLIGIKESIVRELLSFNPADQSLLQTEIANLSTVSSSVALKRI